jgi:serine protease AprX
MNANSLFVHACRVAARRNPLAGWAIACAIAAVACLPAASSAAVLRKSLAALSVKDTVCKVWVLFADKSQSVAPPAVSPRALQRRRMAGARESGIADAPVSPAYIKQIESLDGRCVNIFKWANAASFIVPSSRLDACASLACVRDLLLVRQNAADSRAPSHGGLGKKAAIPSNSSYGVSYAELAMLAVPPAHRWLGENKLSPPGSGIIIGFFDSGFRLKHRCFSYLNANNLVLADSDFIDHDNTVYDPDSVVNDPTNPYFHNDEHGSMTLSLVAGYDPPQFLGVAWGARFILARTEDSPVEKHYEEDNWAAAMVWAESLGVDIVSSSLGYNTDFTLPDTDYTFQDMNGKTTIISKAAAQAVEYGVVVVNSMGNKDTPKDTFLSAPADVDGVVSVGAVDASLTIASFSQRGPTADGRMKPECVAMGVGASVPEIYFGGTGYTSGNGTSFSAPLVAGVTALTLQAHPGDSAADVRRRLYASCFLVPGQNAADNVYGRGVPDALLSVLADSQTYITVADSFGRVVAGAVVSTSSGVVAGASDSAGYAVVNVRGPFPETLLVAHPSYLTGRVAIPSRHARTGVVLVGRYVLRVALRDSADSAAIKGTVFWKNGSDAVFFSQATDSSGIALITAAQSPQVELYGEAPGYFGSGKTGVVLNVGSTKYDTLRLKPRQASQFVIYPNVINSGARHQQLTFEFTSAQDAPRAYSQLFTAAIRSIDGTLVWHYSKVLDERTPLVLRWPDAGSTATPGMYYFVITYGGKTYKKKFLVTG